MNTQTYTHDSYNGGKLNRTEAQLVTNWLRKIGKKVPSGWMMVWKLDAEEVANAFNVSKKDVIEAGNGRKRNIN